MSSRTPRTIGIIMDGNRRYAKHEGIPTLEGHRRGYEKMKEVISWSKEAGVENLIVYAFSTENWHRAPEEVQYLMELLHRALIEMTDVAKKEGIRLRIIGERNCFAPDIQEAIMRAEKETEDEVFTFVIALSYGGRAEILQAITRILKDNPDTVTEEQFSAQLWTNGIPNPDMIIRTGGEKRLSGFLPWQSVYSELFFTDTFWQAFTRDEFLRMLEEYAERDRRYGS